MSTNRTSTSIRDDMLGYWKNFTPSVESMMLDKNATMIHVDEQAEILELLPDFSGKDVLELGAGIGRYTGTLAETARHVTAVDFVEDYVSINKRCNGHLRNIQFITADVTSLQLPIQRYNVVFSNWLFMYLTDYECIKLLQQILKWLVDDGYIFIRESCFHSSGNMSRVMNPTFYRSPADYQNLLESARAVGISFNNTHQTDGFRMIEAGALRSYIKHKNNSYQIYFLGRKVEKEMDCEDSFQQFLDQKQYTRRGVLRYEWIFGKTFLSTGGLCTTEKFDEQLDLEPGMQVLDVGCGLGGHSFYMAEKFGVDVLGVDLSANMMSIAIENLMERTHLKNKVRFVLCDITKASYEENSFDAIYSRDTLLHVKEKTKLFENFFKWLKPGGKILFTDYSKGEQPQSEDMREYVQQRGYHLLTTKEYKELLIESGFVDVSSRDQTDIFLDMLRDELDKLRTEKSLFLQEFSVEDYRYLEAGWTDKIQRATNGDQKFAFCYATKPN